MSPGRYFIYFNEFADDGSHSKKVVGMFSIKDNAIYYTSGIAKRVPIGPIDHKVELMLNSFNNGYFHIERSSI